MALLTGTMAWLANAIAWVNTGVWGPLSTSIGEVPGLLVVILLGVGLFLTVRLRFVQVRRFPEAVRTIVPEQSGSGGALSPFQAFMTALAASIGTGNIAGVATAIVSGGPGALFWIWAYGFVATAIKFSEASLGLKFRVARGDAVSSGPMYYLKNGLKSPFLASTYALVAAVAALTTTPFTQPNSIAVVFQSQFALPTWVTGIAVAVLTWLVIIGGVKSIGRAAEKLSPLKVGLYLAGGLIVILAHWANVPGVLARVFREAFSLRAAAGSAVGIGVMQALRFGLARGVYANEAGYGTAAVAYGTARSARPEQQGLNAVMEVFIVSFVTSTISALTILVTGLWEPSAVAIRHGIDAPTSTALVAQAFNTTIPTLGGWVVAFCAFLFGYTTLIGWAFYGEQFFEYLLGVRVTTPYRWIYCLLIPFGAMARVDIVWAWGDLMNGLQVFPNVIGLVGLSGLVAGVARTVSGRSAGPPGITR
jgi:AGCS family alanine or glycine:cation symporter